MLENIFTRATAR